MRLNLFEPSTDVFKRSRVINRISKNYSSCTFVVSLSNCSEPLLTSCVPNLQLYFRSINIQHFYFKINSYCCNITLFKFALTKSSKEIGFADSTVSDDDNFKDFDLLLIFFGHFNFSSKIKSA